MSKVTEDNKPRKSLRSQYIFAASLVSVFLIIASLFSNLYFKKISSENTAALNLHHSISTLVSQLENTIWQGDKSLYTLIISSDSNNANAIISKLNNVKNKLHSIKSINDFEKTGLSIQLNNLERAHKQLKHEIYNLLELRKDINWLYPMLPFITTKLLESNSIFETAVNQAITETIELDGGKYSGKVLRELDSLRNNWRLKILSFRGLLIRFAGLNTKNITQETDIENYHLLILNKIKGLMVSEEKGELGFETEVAINDMHASSKKWFADYQDLLKIRKSNIWRSDIHYIQTKIQPLQENVFSELAELKVKLNEWSSTNTKHVEKAALQINLELWIFTSIAIVFVIIIYRMLERTLLIPIANISDSINVQGNIIENISILQAGSKEVNILINSFNNMRRQIHHRQMALEFQAMHDSLTGLPNRSLLQDRTEQAIHLAERNKTEMSLLLLDLDRFKDINDTLGHPIGDKVLREIAKRLEKSLRASDTVARLGGDEFAIITSHTSHSQIEEFVKRVVKDIEKIIIIGEQKLTVGVSIGIATYPLHGEDPETLIRHADIAMYTAKRENKNQEFYEVGKDYNTADDLTLLADLKSELKNPSNQIQLYFQPQIDLKAKKIVGVESLIRWIHPEQGSFPAEHIIRLAEQTGLISSLTNWVINESINQYVRLDNDEINMSINLSVWNLQDPNLTTFVGDKLKENKIKPNNITFEITESAVMNDPVRAEEVLTSLSEMGINLAVDDYGTGFSSLAYLKLLPVNYLKIDKSFVIDMMKDENDLIIVQSTIDLAHNLGLFVVAEGVEDKVTLTRLCKLGCDYAQGYHFSKPMPADKLNLWLNNYKVNI